jgi:hypothetical protein
MKTTEGKPIVTLSLEQEAVKRKNPTREMTQRFDFHNEGLTKVMQLLVICCSGSPEKQ